MVVLVKFSLLHKNMEVIDAKQEHSLNYIYVNQVINWFSSIFYINWLKDITNISSPPSLSQDFEVNAIGHITKQEETMNYKWLKS